MASHNCRSWWPRWRTLPHVSLVALLLALAQGTTSCGDDEAEEGVAADVADAASGDAGAVADLGDSEENGKCRGLKPTQRAELHDAECDGITECTVMPEKEGGCYCAICGPKGPKIACLHVACAVPEGGG